VKQCSKCGEQKPLDQFYKASRNKDGRTNDCGDCRREYNLARYHREKSTGNPERNAKRRKRKSYRSYSLRKRYGITVEQYDQLVAKQNNRCAICQQPEQQTDPRYGTLLELAVDHDHNTGQIRGLLCSACNTAIGKFGDNPETLRAAITYLERQKPPAETGGQC
jgi:hypothetical protein